MFKEMSLLLGPNNSFFSTRFRDTLFDVKKAELVFSYIRSQMSVFLNNSIGVYPVKLKIGIDYHMYNSFQNTLLDIYQSFEKLMFKAFFTLSCKSY